MRKRYPAVKTPERISRHTPLNPEDAKSLFEAHYHPGSV